MEEQKHILVINPNTTASMTTKIGEVARQAAGSNTRITAINPQTGPAAIQGAEDGAAALPGLFSLVDRCMASPETYDALVIACFDDTGIWDLKDKLPIPVLGIGEAAYHVAALTALRFSVVTTLSASVPVLKDNLKRMGFDRRCARVRASEVPVLELEDIKGEGRDKVRQQISRALKEDNIGAIALGCAGMAGFAADLSDEFSIPVIDGVASAIRLGSTLFNSRNKIN